MHLHHNHFQNSTQDRFPSSLPWMHLTYTTTIYKMYLIPLAYLLFLQCAYATTSYNTTLIPFPILSFNVLHVCWTLLTYEGHFIFSLAPMHLFIRYDTTIYVKNNVSYLLVPQCTYTTLSNPLTNNSPPLFYHAPTPPSSHGSKKRLLPAIATTHRISLPRAMTAGITCPRRSRLLRRASTAR